MAGSASLATIAAISSAAIGAGSLAYGIKSGLDAQGAQETALKKQTTAQQTATASALSTERKGELAQNAANMKTPDITSILQRAVAGGKGLTSTMLTGPAGVDPGGLDLGKSTLLGA